MASPISGFQQYVDISAGPPPIMLPPAAREGQARDVKDSFAGRGGVFMFDSDPVGNSEVQDAPVSRVVFNPFQATFPKKMRWTFDRRRWAHVYMKTQASTSDVAVPARLEPVGIQDLNWASLTEPAVLPLTTDFLPPPSALVEHSLPYKLDLSSTSASGDGKASGVHAHKSQKSHHLRSLSRRHWLFDTSTNREGLTLGPDVEDAVGRMVCQRLDHEFQVVDMTVASKDGYRWMRDPSAKPLCAMSSANHIHVIMLEEPNVMVVSQYPNKAGEASVTKVSCLSVFHIWDPVTQSAVKTSRVFSLFPKDFTHLRRELNWNTLDQVACYPQEYRISGESLKSLDEVYVRYNHVCFVVFPSNFGVPTRSHGSSNAAAAASDEAATVDATVAPIDKSDAVDPPPLPLASVNSSQALVSGSVSTAGMLPVVQFMDTILHRHAIGVSG